MCGVGAGCGAPPAGGSEQGCVGAGRNGRSWPRWLARPGRAPESAWPSQMRSGPTPGNAPQRAAAATHRPRRTGPDEAVQRARARRYGETRGPPGWRCRRSLSPALPVCRRHWHTRRMRGGTSLSIRGGVNGPSGEFRLVTDRYKLALCLGSSDAFSREGRPPLTPLPRLHRPRQLPCSQ